MITEERMTKILEILKEKEFVSIQEISEKLYISISTVRRDLINLEKSGAINRVRGGASLVKEKNQIQPSNIRSKINTVEKRIIANLALKFIKEDMSIFMDASSTVQFLCPKLENFKRLILITNSATIPYMLNDNRNINIYCSGGFLKPNSHYFIGSASTNFISEFSTDIYFMSCKSIDFNNIYDADYEQIQLKKLMIKNSKKTVLLVDSSKFDENSFIKLSNLSDITYIITDKKPKNFEKYDKTIQEKFIWPDD